MNAPGTVAALLSENRLSDALAVAVDASRTRPQDLSARLLLADLLILSGDFARADAQAEIATRLHPAEALGLSRLRGLLRGMEARRRWYEDGAVPSFPDGPGDLDRLALRLALALRSGEGADAAASLAELEARRGSGRVAVDGAAASGLRDLDDRLPHTLEAVTDGGAYLWIDFSRIATLRLQPAARTRDLAWRRAELTLRDGSRAEVLLPLTYEAGDPSESERLARTTRWEEAAGGLVTGRGQRCLLVGEEVRALGECVSIEFEPAPQHAGTLDG